MKVIWGLDEVRREDRTITTLGSYDGVHLGHLEILQKLDAAKQASGYSRSVLLTFHPHPQQVLHRNNTNISLLTTIEERLDILSRTGIDEAVVIRFDEEFSRTSYIDFFQDILVKRLGTEMMVVGFNHAFGRNREGDAARLKTLAPSYGVTVEEVAPLVVGDLSVSSTKIRNALEGSNLKEANRMLGRPYSFTGTVVKGDRIGTAIGYPTANLEVPAEKLIPGDGVYAARVLYRGRTFNAALSIGHRPTIGAGLGREVEVLLLDFEGDLYGHRLTVECMEYIRPQERYESLDMLRAQIARDAEYCRGILSSS